MAKQKPKKMTPEEIEELQDRKDEAHALKVLEDLNLATSVAKKLFATETPTPDTIFGVFDRLMEDADDEDEAAADLLKAQEICKEMFAAPIPTPEMIFGVFDRLLPPEEEEFEEDEDGEE